MQRSRSAAPCARCDEEYASQQHVDDLIAVERLLGYQYDAPAAGIDHYQHICPRCRRLLPALVQGRMRRSRRRGRLVDGVDAAVQT